MNIDNNFLFLLKPDDDYKEIIFSRTLDNLKEAYIICKESFKDQNFNIEKFAKGQINIKIPDIIRLNFTFDEIMSFKKKKIDFYVMSKERLQSILKTKGIKIDFSTYIYFADQKENKLLCFSNDFRCICFKVKKIQYPNDNKQQNIPPMINKMIPEDNQFINNFNNNIAFDNNNNIIINDNINLINKSPQSNINTINEVPQDNFNYTNSIYNFQNDESKINIIRSLILIYGNEKIIIELYSNGFFDLQNCYLVNKSWIDKFKELYFYNEISSILEMKGINTYNSVLKNFQLLESSNEISSIKNKINIDTYALTQYNLSPETKNIGEFNFPINFVIINDKLKNLILQYSNSGISSEYEISFGISELYIRLKYDLNKIYCYNYQNNSFNLSGIIELLADIFKEIYDKHLSKKPFTQYLNEKQINLGISNQKQELFSSGKKLLGYIYLPSTKVGQNLEQNIPIMKDINTKENILIEGDLNKKIDFNIIYQKFVNSFKTLKDKNLALPNIKTIKGYISSNLLINLPVFIIELQMLKYCFETIKQYKNTLDGYSFFLSDDYIINSDLANEYTDYSFINEEIIKYFKVQNINHTKKAHVFFNQKSLFVFYPNQNCLLKILNYKNNAFTIKKLTQQNPTDNIKENIPQTPIVPNFPQQDENHSLGLENIGATCYMNATLQCLSNVRSLREYFLDDNKYNQDVLGRSTQLTKSFANVLRKLWSQTSETYYAPKEFKEIISKMNPLFKGIQANDSKDLVLFLYENIHRELNNPSENPIDVNLDNIRNELKLFRNNYYPQNYSIISKIFYYEQTSIMQCKRCNFMTYNYNIMNMIIFPLEKVRLYMAKKKPEGFTNITLNDCFEQNEQPEKLEGSNQITTVILALMLFHVINLILVQKY